MVERYRVCSNPVGGQIMYGVFRIKDPAKIDHSGNREVVGWHHDRERAEAEAKRLNAILDRAMAEGGLKENEDLHEMRRET